MELGRAKYEILLAALLGAGVTSLLALSLGTMFAFAAMVLLAPGAIPVALVWRSQDLGPAPAVLAANSLVYAGLTYLFIRFARARVRFKTVRVVTVASLIPVAVLVLLACLPAKDPLWPSGMEELASTERYLRGSFRQGLSVEESRGVLRAKGIQFSEQAEPAAVRQTITAEGTKPMSNQGGRILFARTSIGAFQFPCGYEVQVTLTFDRKDELIGQEVRRVRICP